METIGADLEVMKRVPLADDHLAAIREIAEERHYHAGAIVADVGEPMDKFVYVLEGEVELVDPYSGERLYESGIGATQFMGEIAFLNSGSYYLPMRASMATRTLEAPREAMLALMARVPELSDHVITVFAARRQRQFASQGSAIKVIGADRDPQVQRVESFLARNRIPFQSFDLDSAEAEASRLCQLAHHEPAVIFARDHIVAEPTPRKIARLLHLDLDAGENPEVDLLIVGGGPAGVAAAVYAGAEGVAALVIEDAAIGGQAGTSSRIENYMGFPTGISGSDLVYRGQIQALKFGTRFAMPRRVSGLEQRPDGLFCATIEDGVICARALLVATGVQYRRLPIDRLADLEGKGVFYAATEMEARFCRKTEVVVIGGGNSAGQAAMYLSRVARHVHVVVRGGGLAESMSAYLSQRLEADPRITIHYHTEVSALHGDDHLQGVTLKQPGGDNRIDTSALFVMIGAAPNTEWLSGLVELDERGFVRTGAEAGAQSPYETSRPGIFAVGDVRTGSVKRVASAVGEGSVVISAIWYFLENGRNSG
ncbi:FAD-dependent oxidoreductase [Novosphingobium album (ex Liu et al. 2023)]|uniref:Thioredoxin reductase n=1 Tax=Novosphingobium album (ex Liu et al. 2023) TaxID=3031130 RepID=A0ABT5WL10_9SPHN|nr:FAD-dependent oxidoreductase [Novosphingobium album (ex Liu et al. 2023)]MDE8650716.1 FAD-dependent oxidoreductase [Novosphingobium album (ex Liu et al. 2023)]